MSDQSDYPTSAASLAGHPVHSMIAAFPTACFVGALISDIVYWRSPSFLWETFSVWLLAVGLFFGVLAAIAGLIDFVAKKRIRKLAPGWPHALGNGLVLLLSLINAFVHSRDGYTAVVPTGIILSALVVVLLLVTEWLGWTMVHRYRVGVVK